MNYQEFLSKTQTESAILFYFSHNDCNVCKVLKPKVKSLLENQFEKIKFAYINIHEHPEVAAQNRVFAVPTILLFIDGQLTIQKNRNVSISELAKEIERPYNLFFT